MRPTKQPSLSNSSRRVYLLLCIISAFLGIALQFLQFYGAKYLKEHTNGLTFGGAMQMYTFTMSITTGILLFSNSLLAIAVLLTDKKDAGVASCLKNMVGPCWIVTATVCSSTVYYATQNGVSAPYLRGPPAKGTFSLAMIGAIVSFILACFAFFLGHACCYCTRNRHEHQSYVEIETQCVVTDQEDSDIENQYHDEEAERSSSHMQAINRALFRRRVYIVLCIICALFGIGLILIQFLVAGKFKGLTLAEVVRSYLHGMSLATGLLMLSNSILALVVRLTANNTSKLLVWLRTLMGPWWILTATAAMVTAQITIFYILLLESMVAMCLAFVGAILCYVQAGFAFFAGHACCYCVRKRQTSNLETEVQVADTHHM